MADQIQLRGGTAAESAAFTGASREVTVDTTNNTLRVHDGTTAGGHLLATAADLTTTQSAQTAALTALGLSSGDTSLGTFTGSTIGDNQTLKQVIQVIETLLENKASLLGLAGSSTNLGTFNGSTISDGSSIKIALQTLETQLEAVDIDTDDMATLVGLAENVANLGTFSGSTIQDNESIKDALQQLETATELRAPIASPEFTGHVYSPEFKASGTGHLKLRAETGNDLNVYLANQETLQITRDPSTGNPKFTAKGGTGEFKFNQAITEPSFSGHAYSPEWRATGTGHLKLRAETGNDLIVYLANTETLQVTRHSGTGNPHFTAVGGSGEFKFNQLIEAAGGVKIDSVGITTIQTGSESFVDNDTSLMTSAAINDLIGANGTTLADLGITSTAAELNILDGVTATAAELNYVDGVTSAVQTQINTVVASAAVSTGILNATPGTVTAQKAVITDADKDAKGFRVIEADEYHSNGTGHLKFKGGGNDIIFYPQDTETLQITRSGTDVRFTSNGGSGTFKFNQEVDLAGGMKLGSVAITSTAAELNILDGVTSTAAELNLLDGVTATTAELNYVDGVTSAIQTQLDTKSPIASPTFTGTPAAPTAGAGTNTTQIATTAFVQTAVSATNDGAPGALDTLNELAAALGDDANFSTTITNLINANETHIDNVATLSGVAKDSTHLSTFTGSTISDNQTIKAAIQALETAVETKQATDAELTELATMASTTAAALADLLEAEVQILDGATVTTAELNILDGVTSTAAELNILDGVTSTAAELNILDGVTSTATELNLLDGVTATTAELNYVDGVTSAIQTQLDAKLASSGAQAALHVDHIITLSGVAQASDDLGTFSGSTISDSQTIKQALQALETAVEGKQATDAELTELATMASNTAAALADLTQAEVQILDGATVTTAELNILDGVTSTAAELNILDGVTSTAAELNILDGVTSTAAELNLLDGVTATTAELNYVDGVTSAIQTQLDAKLASSGAKAALDVDHLITLSGVSAAADNLGTFTGSTISDNGTVKAGMQELETAVETKVGAANSNLTGTTVVAAIDLSGDIDCDGTANLDAVDIDGDVDLAGDFTFSAAKDIHFIDNDAAALEFAEGGNVYLTFVTTDGSNAIKFSKNLDIDASDIDLSTQAVDLTLIDNTAQAFRIMEGSTEYLRVTTTNSSEKIDISAALQLDGAVDINGAVDCSGDVTFSDAQTISVTDNLGFALRIMEGSNEYVRFTTTDGSELVDFSKTVKLDGGMTLGGGISVPASQDITMVASNSNAIDFVIDGGNRMMRFNTNTETVLMEQNIDVDGTANLDAVDIDGDVDLAGDLTFSAAKDIQLIDNNAAALEIAEAGNNYLTFDTSDSAERVHAKKDLVQNPASSIAPASNGELVVEATNNTTLTFKLKGSDGTVRTGTITLS